MSVYNTFSTQSLEGVEAEQTVKIDDSAMNDYEVHFRSQHPNYPYLPLQRPYPPDSPMDYEEYPISFTSNYSC